MYLLRLALRNVGRNRRRSVLAVVSVALALLLIVSLQGYIRGVMGSMVKNYTKNETGHVRITTREFERKQRFSPVTENISDPSAIQAAIAGDPTLAREVALVTQRVVFGVLLSKGGNNKAVAALAGEPEVEKQLLMLQDALLPGGRYLAGEREVILGKRAADALGYSVGDTVRVMAQGSDYALHLRKLLVVGLFETGITALDDGAMQMRIDDARDLLRMGSGTQQILVMLHDYREADAMAAAIAGRLADTTLAVTSWTHIGDYYRMVQGSASIYNVIYLVVGLLGAFIIGNIMMMVVMERRKEIGIMKSMGVSRREILVLFLLEGTILGLVGSVAGTLGGVGLVAFFNWYGIDLSAFMDQLRIPIDSVVRPVLHPGDPVLAIVLGTVLAGLVSLGPSRRAASMNAVDSIKSV